MLFRDTSCGLGPIILGASVLYTPVRVTYRSESLGWFAARGALMYGSQRMAALAESLVDAWLNRQGFFTVRGLKHGIDEIDLLGVRPNN